VAAPQNEYGHRPSPSSEAESLIVRVDAAGAANERFINDGS